MNGEGASLGDSRESRGTFSQVAKAFRVSTASESTRKSGKPLIEEGASENNPEIMDPFSPSFNQRLMMKEK